VQNLVSAYLALEKEKRPHPATLNQFSSNNPVQNVAKAVQSMYSDTYRSVV
jgi:hypothetical protein